MGHLKEQLGQFDTTTETTCSCGIRSLYSQMVYLLSHAVMLQFLVLSLWKVTLVKLLHRKTEWLEIQWLVRWLLSLVVNLKDTVVEFVMLMISKQLLSYQHNAKRYQLINVLWNCKILKKVSHKMVEDLFMVEVNLFMVELLFMMAVRLQWLTLTHQATILRVNGVEQLQANTVS